MRTFTGYWANRALILFWLALGCSAIGFGVAILFKTRDTPAVAGTILFFLLGGGFSAVSVYCLVESFAKYRIDPDEISRFAWDGARSMRWSEIERFDSTGQKDDNVTLFGQDGRKLTILFTFLKKGDQLELREAVEARLKDVRERQQRDLIQPGRVYHPMRPLGWVGILMLVMTGVMAVVFAFIPTPPDQRVYSLALFGMLGACAAGFGAMAAAGFTDSLYLTEQSILQRSWFRTREIPFHHVTSVMARMMSYKGSTWEATTIEGDGRKILFTSKMPDYPIVVDFVKGHVRPEALAQGEAAAVKIEKKQQKNARFAAPIIGLVYFLLLGGLGLWFLQRGNERAARYDLLKREGRPVMGRIEGKHASSGRDSRYVLEYTFNVGGRTMHSSSSVSYDDYLQAGFGSPLPVIYAPKAPEVSSAAASIDGSRAQGDIRLGIINIVLACVFPPLIGGLTYFRKKQTGPAAVRPPGAPSGSV